MEGGPSAPLPDGKAIAITVVRGPDTGLKHELLGSRVVIGRKRGDVLLKDRETSSLHASIEYHPDGRFILKDLGSTNGTWLDGKRVTVAEIRPGQHIKVGANHLLFAVVDAASEATTQGRFEDRASQVSLPSPGWSSAGQGPPPTLDLPRSPQAAAPPAWSEPPSAVNAPWPAPPPPVAAPPPSAAPPSAPVGPPPSPPAREAFPPLPPAWSTPQPAAPPAAPAPLPPLPQAPAGAPWPAAPPAPERGTEISPARPLTAPVPAMPAPAATGRGLPPGVEPSVYGIYLVVERGRDRGKVFAVNRQVTVLGRSGTEILINDPDISRRHAALDVQGEGKYVLRDLNSTNGTLLNGVSVHSEGIGANDKIRMGSTTIKLVVGDEKVAPELARIAAEPAHH